MNSRPVPTKHNVDAIFRAIEEDTTLHRAQFACLGAISRVADPDLRFWLEAFVADLWVATVYATVRAQR